MNQAGPTSSSEFRRCGNFIWSPYFLFVNVLQFHHIFDGIWSIKIGVSEGIHQAFQYYVAQERPSEEPIAYIICTLFSDNRSSVQYPDALCEPDRIQLPRPRLLQELKRPSLTSLITFSNRCTSSCLSSCPLHNGRRVQPAGIFVERADMLSLVASNFYDTTRQL